MNDKKSPFQIILFAILIVAIISGVLLFSMKRRDQTNVGSPVNLWGTVDEDIISSYLTKIKDLNPESVNVNYRQLGPDLFEKELVEALASGVGPDAVILKDDLLIKHENKIYTIPYQYFPQKNFKDSFIEAGEALIKNDGIVGIPFMIDPLVMYWNRSALNSAGISFPPKYWDELIKHVPLLTKKDSSFNVSKSALSFGEYKNVKNAKEIIYTLILQAGNPIVTRDLPASIGGVSKYKIDIEQNNGYAVMPADAALNYYTQFSNPTKSLYSWNRSLPNSEDMFLSGNLAFYFGHASEYVILKKKNPNLNFDVSVVPQSRNNESKYTYGDLYFIGIIKSSKNITGAFSAANVLTSSDNIKMLSQLTYLPPVRRELLAGQNNNAVLQNFNLSAIIAKPFLDPDSAKTDKIFSDMIESYTSGRSLLQEAIGRAQNELERISI